MAQTETTKLDARDPFPHMTLTLVDGSKLILPDDMHGSWSIFLIYRGHW
jgi:hypothetical protein